MRATLTIAPATAIAALLLSAAAAPAFAARDNISVRTIHVADLNLASLQGQKALRSRINHALEGVCGPYEPFSEDRVEACRVEARARIDQKLAAIEGKAHAMASAR